MCPRPLAPPSQVEHVTDADRETFLYALEVVHRLFVTLEVRRVAIFIKLKEENVVLEVFKVISDSKSDSNT